MSDRPAVIEATWWIVALVLAAIVVGAVALLRTDRTGERGSGLADRFEYDIAEHETIDPAIIRCREIAQIPTQLQEARAVAVGPEDRICVAGDAAIHVFDASGALGAKIGLEGEPTCVAVGGTEHAFPGRIYAGVGRGVEVREPDGKPVATWEVPGDKVRLTSIALAEDDVFVANCAGRIVLRFDAAGELVGRIGERDAARGVPGFVIPSPFFDVAVRDDVLWVVNPGARRLEAYSFEGRLDLYWGESSVDVEGFFGCCNPANFALLPDGSFVTAEKGLLRVKVYTEDGQFDCVVAGPEQLDPAHAPNAAPQAEGRFDREMKAVDVAADARGRILILDPARGSVRVFKRIVVESDERELEESDTEMRDVGKSDAEKRDGESN